MGCGLAELNFMNYQVRIHPRAKKLTLRLDKSGEPIVTVPRTTPKILVKKFIQDQQSWILEKQNLLRKKRQQFVSKNSVTIFGKQRHKPDKNLDTFLKNTAKHYLIPRANRLAKEMGVGFNKITLRQQQTRWGSCSSKGNLSFNWRLVHFEPAIIDYVIIHELAHLKHPNHSADFWQLVKKHDPEYQLHRGWLKRHGIGVG
jgi:predicted metal-dependent hydrolase